MKDTVSAVAFDIDGTLYPTWKCFFRIIPFFLTHIPLMIAFRKARKEIHHWCDEHPEERIPHFFDFQAQLVAKQLHKDPLEVKKILFSLIYEGWRPLFEKIIPFPYVKESIIELKKQGYKIGILSDFLPDQKGDIWGILPLCDVCLGSEEIGALKPSAVPFQVLAEQLEIHPSKILYVGNHIKYDVQGAKKVGMKTAYIQSFFQSFFNQKIREADISFPNYRKFMEIMV